MEQTQTQTQPDARGVALVIEDDHDNRELLVRLLRHCGLNVDSAAGVREAVDKLAAVPKVVLLDIQLPDGDGIDVLRFIRAHQLPTTVGVVTGSSEVECLAELRTFVPDRIFIKPVDVHELLSWVQAYMSHRTELS